MAGSAKVTAEAFGGREDFVLWPSRWLRAGLLALLGFLGVGLLLPPPIWLVGMFEVPVLTLYLLLCHAGTGAAVYRVAKGYGYLLASVVGWGLGAAVHVGAVFVVVNTVAGGQLARLVSTVSVAWYYALLYGSLPILVLPSAVLLWRTVEIRFGKPRIIGPT